MRTQPLFQIQVSCLLNGKERMTDLFQHSALFCFSYEYKQKRNHELMKTSWADADSSQIHCSDTRSGEALAGSVQIGEVAPRLPPVLTLASKR